MSPLVAAFWNQPIDLLLYQLLTWFGWIPLTVTTILGLVKVWQFYRQIKWAGTLEFVLLSIDVPSLTEQTPKAMEHFFATLTGAYSGLNWKETWIIGKFQASFAFEIVSTDGYVQFYARTLTKYRDAVEAGIYAHYPDAEISEVEDYTHHFPHHFPNETHEMWGAEATLTKEVGGQKADFFPIRTYKDFEDSASKEIHDPLGQSLELLAKMRPGESFWMQFVCGVTNDKWKEPGIEYINKIYGIEKPHHEHVFKSTLRQILDFPDQLLQKTIGTGPIISHLLLGPQAAHKEEDQWKAFKVTPHEAEQAKAVLAKVSKPGFRVKTRLIYIARKELFRKGDRVLLVKGLLNQYTNQNANKFGLAPLTIPKDDYFWQKWSYAEKQNNLMSGYMNRSMGTGATPSILNTEELASLWHFPAIGVHAPLINKSEAKRAEPPTGLPIGSDAEDVILQGSARMAARAHTEETEAAAHGFPAHVVAHGSADDHHAPADSGSELPHPSIDGGSAGGRGQEVVDGEHGASENHGTGNPPVVALGHDEHAAHGSDNADMPHPMVKHGSSDPSSRTPLDDKRGATVHGDDEHEEGLDATDMGPPADVQLPGPPAGWREPDPDEHDTPLPPNLPI